jgi:hypothetical protein
LGLRSSNRMSCCRQTPNIDLNWMISVNKSRTNRWKYSCGIVVVVVVVVNLLKLFLCNH